MRTRRFDDVARWSWAALVLFAWSVGGRCEAASGTEGASFLDIPVGGGPAALGGAYSALASDAYAPVYNPAGLAFLETTQIAGQHLSYLESIHYEYLGFVHPFEGGRALGASLQFLGTGDIHALDNSGQDVGTYSSHYGAYSLAYGQKFGDSLAIGASGKIVEGKISNISAHAYAVDVGSLYQATERLMLSAGFANIGNRLTFISQGDTLPRRAYVGASFHANNHCLVSVEGLYNGTGLVSGRMGLQWRPLQMIALRAGYRTETLKDNTWLAGFSTGVGLELWGHELDYAWVPYGDLGNTQYFSLVLRFGQERAERKKLIQFQDIKTHSSAKSSSRAGSPERLESAEEPELQQLMQLLNDDPDHIAAGSNTANW